ncbi:hypothetical protein [Nucisporomicrobium flavum]|uniref:hypothetical protein n=1 Tax=Nucisporomicrobium flavum TaxID=2785915 RepID=UPI0018F45101|nr:hypothetical protein [Nucisporomicrobium flavum]
MIVRPPATALLAAIMRPDRASDAIANGEDERAFCGNQLERLLPLLLAHHVQVWLPEAGVLIDPGDPAHQALPCCWTTTGRVRVHVLPVHHGRDACSGQGTVPAPW